VTVSVTQAGQVDDCGQGIGAACGWVLSPSAPVTLAAGLQTAGDEDWYEFTAPATGTWVFESSGIPSPSNTYGHILDANGTQLAYNNDSGGGLNFKVSAKLTTGQVYYLRVRNYSATTTSPANPYTITATPPQ
jgi:serralysin